VKQIGICKDKTGNTSALFEHNDKFYRMNPRSAKIACIDCDEVSTEAAWAKSGSRCPKCGSYKGVKENPKKTWTRAEAESIADELEMDIEMFESDHWIASGGNARLEVQGNSFRFFNSPESSGETFEAKSVDQFRDWLENPKKLKPSESVLDAMSDVSEFWKLGLHDKFRSSLQMLEARTVNYRAGAIANEILEISNLKANHKKVSGLLKKMEDAYNMKSNPESNPPSKTKFEKHFGPRLVNNSDLSEEAITKIFMAWTEKEEAISEIGEGDSFKSGKYHIKITKLTFERGGIKEAKFSITPGNYLMIFGDSPGNDYGKLMVTKSNPPESNPPKWTKVKVGRYGTYSMMSGLDKGTELYNANIGDIELHYGKEVDRSDGKICYVVRWDDLGDGEYNFVRFTTKNNMKKLADEWVALAKAGKRPQEKYRV